MEPPTLKQGEDRVYLCDVVWIVTKYTASGHIVWLVLLIYLGWEG